MALGEYFDSVKGVGVLSTADADGKVDAALYARTHEAEDGSLVFVMRGRLTHHNLQSNPNAAFLFLHFSIFTSGFLKGLLEDAGIPTR